VLCVLFVHLLFQQALITMDRHLFFQQARVVRYHQELPADVLCGLYLYSVSVAKVVHLTLLSISHTQVPPLERHLSGTKGIGRHAGMRVSSGVSTTPFRKYRFRAIRNSNP
jgi:hypothetical protein